MTVPAEQLETVGIVPAALEVQDVQQEERAALPVNELVARGLIGLAAIVFDLGPGFTAVMTLIENPPPFVDCFRAVRDRDIEALSEYVGDYATRTIKIYVKGKGIRWIIERLS